MKRNHPAVRRALGPALCALALSCARRSSPRPKRPPPQPRQPKLSRP